MDVDIRAYVIYFTKTALFGVEHMRRLPEGRDNHMVVDVRGAPSPMIEARDANSYTCIESEYIRNFIDGRVVDGQALQLEIHIFSTDSFSGTRKLYTPKRFTPQDIVTS